MNKIEINPLYIILNTFSVYYTTFGVSDKYEVWVQLHCIFFLQKISS